MLSALAGSVIGLHKTELIKPQGPWRTAVAFTLLASGFTRLVTDVRQGLKLL